MTEVDPADAVAACRAAHDRIIATAAAVTDDGARAPSRLPGWTVGHVLTHVARNADGHAHRLAGALRGKDLPRYPGGMPARDREIEDGAGRPAVELAADVTESARRLEEVWRCSVEAGWPNAHFLGDDRFTTSGSPLRRLREVEVHHVDLGLGYEPEDWPDLYLDWELRHALNRLPARLSGPDGRRLLAWLTGRAELPTGISLDPWM
ncbi:MAG TPA: maleylpyruvate isomerase N-terminal domain-containing protein [Actinophytocola sp.]|uniref:maleylpyruvate isomerase N-terminal domain-containing protein n=1 Tax=Actinophytocola sp. TaxID=1872138 RepID=UPI002DB8E2C3|nr:maleylpyruvate isomerase N-terminal domain-containing protein [Actinophytocola sp.]HEU5469417.1 maleylpyruvate isomerase N-terminal domain-containing protein [Actinophytocola sp.]